MPPPNKIGEVNIQKMMRNIIYGGQSNDLTKYCNYVKCQKQVLYTPIKTATNDPTISKRTQYARYVRNF